MSTFTTDEMVEAACAAFRAAIQPHTHVGLEAAWLVAKTEEKMTIITAMREALEAAMKEAWRPIETAPKDGTSVLCFDPLNQGGFDRKSRTLVMRWDQPSAKWRTDIVGFIAFDPTHWMPLPPAPKASK